MSAEANQNPEQIARDRIDALLRARLLDLPAWRDRPGLDPQANGLRDCQITAITALEKSFKKAKPRALVQMATGSGKTFTATPDARTYAFFNQSVVSEYTRERAVADGVNVQGEVYLIETEVTQQGGTVPKGLVQKREKCTRRQRWEQRDEATSLIVRNSRIE